MAKLRLVTLGTALGLMLSVAAAPAAEAQGTLTLTPPRVKMQLPKSGDVTLSRVEITVRARHGRLPRGLRLRARVRKRHGLPPSIDGYASTTRLKRGRRSARFAVYIAALNRGSGIATATQAEGDKTDFAEFFFFLVPPRGLRDPAPPPPPKQLEFTTQYDSFPDVLSRFPSFDTFPAIESFEGCKKSEQELEGPGESTYEVMSLPTGRGSPPTASGSAARFTPKQNLNYAFGAGCRHPRAEAKVPDSWFASNRLIVPAKGRQCMSAPVGPWQPICAFGGPGKAAGLFNHPFDVAVDPRDLSFYVIDRDNNRIQKFDSQMHWLGSWGGVMGNAPGQFNRPYAAAVDGRNGDLYVADRDNNRIQKFSAKGTFLGMWGGPGQGAGIGQFAFPSGIAVDPDGNFYVVDRDNSRVIVFDGSGSFLYQWGEKGSAARKFLNAIKAAIRAGRIAVADRGNYRIQFFDLQGNFLAETGMQGAGPGQFNLPEGIGFASTGEAVVADLGNNRVQVLNGDNRSFIAMRGQNGGDGSAGSGLGEFREPAGIGPLPDGRFLVADNGNNRIQLFAGAAGWMPPAPACTNLASLAPFGAPAPVAGSPVAYAAKKKKPKKPPPPPPIPPNPQPLNLCNPKPGPCANVIRGSHRDDVIGGSDFGDRIYADRGGDWIRGFKGDDCIYGQPGFDIIFGDEGDDTIEGNEDGAAIHGGDGNDKISSGVGYSPLLVLYGGAGNDVIRGNGQMVGQSGNDDLKGNAADDIFDGGPGNDTIDSVDRNPEPVEGGPGNDTCRVDRRGRTSQALDRVSGCERVILVP